jgi:DNA-binding NarL/FixJ family response regulator
MKAKQAAKQKPAPADGRNGYPFLSRGSAAFDAKTWGLIQKSLQLSPRELDIVQGVFDDKLETAIAAELGVSAHTVHTETGRLRRKLNAHDRVSLVLLIMEEFLKLTASDETDLPSICRNHAAGRCPLAGALHHTGK